MFRQCVEDIHLEAVCPEVRAAFDMLEEYSVEHMLMLASLLQVRCAAESNCSMNGIGSCALFPQELMEAIGKVANKRKLVESVEVFLGRSVSLGEKAVAAPRKVHPSVPDSVLDKAEPKVRTAYILLRHFSRFQLEELLWLIRKATTRRDASIKPESVCDAMASGFCCRLPDALLHIMRRLSPVQMKGMEAVVKQQLEEEEAYRALQERVWAFMTDDPRNE